LFLLLTGQRSKLVNINGSKDSVINLKGSI
jgi:hypothetical protein